MLEAFGKKKNIVFLFIINDNDFDSGLCMCLVQSLAFSKRKMFRSCTFWMDRCKYMVKAPKCDHGQTILPYWYLIASKMTDLMLSNCIKLRLVKNDAYQSPIIQFYTGTL